MNKKTWIYIRDFIQSTLRSVQFNLDDDSVDAVTHYLDHDEYEMAFEGLFIEIIGLDIAPLIELKKSMEIGKLLKLNEESVFDIEFWDKLENFVKKNVKHR